MGSSLIAIALWLAAQIATVAADGRGPTVLAESGFSGGLVVHAGCGDAGALLALAGASNVLAHALVPTPDRLEAVRREIRAAGASGRVSAMLWEETSLPYADGMVNLLLVEDGGAGPTAEEVDRALAPWGVAGTRRKDKWVWRRKPRPADIDEWTHSRYDATGNAVSSDRRAGPPRFLQWEALPRWNHSVKTSGLVSSRGRIFYILDDSHFASVERSWSLIARDAFNGILLWRHPLTSWGGSRGGKKVGPAQMHRRLVARGERVYATLEEYAPVSVLDAASGKILKTLESTGPAEEFVLSEGILVALATDGEPVDFWRPGGRRARIVAIDLESGKLLWAKDAGNVMPMTLAADGRQVVHHDGKAIVSLDLRTGAARWTSSPTGQKIAYRDSANSDSPGAEKSTIVLAPQFAPTLILYGDVVAFAGGRQLVTVSASGGEELWRSDYSPSNYSVPVDLFGFEGALWGPNPAMNLWRPLSDNLEMIAFDPKTGAVRKEVSGSYDFRFQHHRCHQMKVVNDSVISGRAGIEFLNTDTGDVTANHWTRGSCYFGVMPANGLLYVPPHDCACYVRAKLSGFLATRSVAPERPKPIAEDRRLQRGPAFGQEREAADRNGAEDWPTYRHDAGRSGRGATEVAPELRPAWQSRIGGKLTAPTVAGDRMYVASGIDHALYALDANSGATLWQYTTDAPVDSPPTIHEGLVLFGCRDGSVYALRASDGALVWRFRASPEERWIVSRGQLESAWPICGSVVVASNTVFFSAGRSSYLDGGLRVFGLDPRTGRKLVERPLVSRASGGSQELDEQGATGCLNDILSSDGRRLFLRHQVLDFAGNPRSDRVSHLHGSDGFLSWDTTSRLLWTYAPLYTSPHQGAFYDLRLSRTLFPSGRILVEGDDVVFGFGQNHYEQAKPEPGGQWALFAAEKASDLSLDLSAIEYRKLALGGKRPVRYRWWKRITIQVWAMVQTDGALFVAGPPDSGGAVSPGAIEGKGAAALLAISPDDGRVLTETPLPAPPVWDGMAAASGRLYVSLADGQAICLGPGRQWETMYMGFIEPDGTIRPGHEVYNEFCR